MNSRMVKSLIGEKNRIINKTKNMGTRSITRVHDEGKDSRVILAVYRQMDGHFEGMGAELTAFLTDMTVVNGINRDTHFDSKKVANGMSCLAAQLVAHFKTGIGGIYISDINQKEEFNYDIYIVGDNQLVLEGHGDNKDKILFVNNSIDLDYDEIANFVYPDVDGVALWRMVGLLEKNTEYVMGYDLNDGKKFKKYRIDKIIGGVSKIYLTDEDGNSSAV